MSCAKSLELEMRNDNFWEGYVPEPVKPAPVQVLQRYSPDGEGGMEVDSLGAYVKHQDVTTPPAAQRQWVWLTDEDIEQEFGFIDELLRDCVHRTEAKSRSKNT
jgi:hypothetical protein